MTQGVQNAIIFTLAVHAVALFTLTQITVSDTTPASEQYAEIELFNTEELPQIQDEQPIDPIQQRINERIMNLRSDASKESTLDARSTGISKAEQEAIDRAVERELAELESSEMDRLSAEEKEFETIGLPDEDKDQTRVDTMDDWDKKYEGRVTVEFYLKDRSAMHLDVPGYQCKGRADIVVSITVDDDGEVISAELVSGADPHSCFAEAAIKSAESSRFLPSTSAPRRQTGTLSYAFVAQ
ncbi:MAG: hypothetical protein CMB32_05605 [Euryarchaeota archaeon]|nr:hypothetical protein [Euryarchaeota archaeon]|tara:strand:+ start:328 stop:1050 length:723 start_codon:yes stop_codon:yes gene_type:complete